MIVSSYMKFFISKVSEKFWKIPKKRHISKTMRIWAAIVRGKIRNPWEYPEGTQLQGENLKNWETF